MTAFERGLREVGPGCYAWMLPDGGWGLSNSGLIVGDRESLLVDTHFDLALTQEMLADISRLTEANPISVLFNTHANGDHYFGNQLLPAGTRIIASEAAGRDMTTEDVSHLQDLMISEGDMGDFVRKVFGDFDFAPVVATGPNETFCGEHELEVGGRTVMLYELGPAHTSGDSIAFVPDARVVYAGDLLFVGGTPIVWAGPIDNWIRACDRMLDLPADTYVPGHGNVTDRSGVIEARAYLEYVRDEASARFERGLSIQDAIDDIDLGRFGELGEPERLVQNVVNVYRFLSPDPVDFPEERVFSAMAAIERVGESDRRPR